MSDGFVTASVMHCLSSLASGREEAKLGFYDGAAGLMYLAARFSSPRDYDQLRNVANQIFRGQRLSGVGWFDGAPGIAYVLGRMYELTGHRCFLDTSVRYLKMNMDKELVSTRCELAHGLAGSLIAYSYLAQLSGDRQLANIAEILVIKLLMRAKSFPGCIFWDTSNYQYLPLTGMAHGVSGIAYALKWADCSRSSGAVSELLRRIRLYEDSVFLKRYSNWIDLRDMSEEGFDIHSAPALRTMDAWCHGRPGILLSMIYPYQETLSQKAFGALQGLKDCDDDVGSRTGSLCHGRAGKELIGWRVFNELNLPNHKSNIPTRNPRIETLDPKGGLLLGAAGQFYASLLMRTGGCEDVLTPGYRRPCVDDVQDLLGSLASVTFTKKGDCEYLGMDGNPVDLRARIVALENSLNSRTSTRLKVARQSTVQNHPENGMLRGVLQYRPWKVSIRNASRANEGATILTLSPFLQASLGGSQDKLLCTSMGEKGLSRFKLDASLYDALVQSLPCHTEELLATILTLLDGNADRRSGREFVGRLISIGVVLPRSLARRACLSPQEVVASLQGCFARE